ncbi:MAG: sigma-54-dependent Fis family transcriptional regulator [Planctomycetaceae bacterium]|nr:sigma-54-dependent Fis family transcriptional regulator [Planctomycetaceae bacterium]
MPASLKVLVVDDDRLNRLCLTSMLKEAGHQADACDSAMAALEAMDRAPFDLLFTDVRMPGMDGLQLLAETKARHPSIDVVLITAYGSVEAAVEAMRAGAADYLTKPFELPELVFRLSRLIELRAARSEVNSLRALLGHHCHCGIVGNSPAIQRVYQRIHAFADNDAPVLITGETGTGKELVARALHVHSHRGKQPFIAVGCGTIPRELAESELFGHEKGAFTGATQRRKGSFERADGGTLLLDDIDDLPLDLQVKLLRVLQDGTLRRVGGDDEVQVNVRVVATSKIDLEQAVAAGRFRDDVFYRLRGLEICLPPLRERGDDMLIIAQHFLRTLPSVRQSRPCSISAAAARALKAYPWRGNVRELKRAVETSLVLCRGEEILVEHLPDYVVRQGVSSLPQSLFSINLEGREEIKLKELVSQFEDEIIDWALTKADGQQAKAAELLGLPRTTLQSRLSPRRQAASTSI